MLRDTTSTQQWMRIHARRLLLSFEGSGLKEHAVSKGTDREGQVLDTLRYLLPTHVSVEDTSTVIVDRKDEQSPSFDGALVNRQFWPCFPISGPQETKVSIAVMIESVLAAIEIKSTLDTDEITDIYRKSYALRGMASQNEAPLVTAFAYQCVNLNLAFFDFAAHYERDRFRAPSLVCVLNQGLFGLVRNADDAWAKTPGENASPALYLAGEDALLTYIYFLSEWVSADPRIARSFHSYCDEFFRRLTCFHFDRDFLNVIREDQDAAARARACFARRARESIEDLYAAARTEVGLG